MHIQNIPVDVLRRMYTRGYLTSTEMCQLAIALKNKTLQREFCKRKRNNSSNKNKNSSAKKTIRRPTMRAKRPWLK